MPAKLEGVKCLLAKSEMGFNATIKAGQEKENAIGIVQNVVNKNCIQCRFSEWHSYFWSGVC